MRPPTAAPDDTSRDYDLFSIPTNGGVLTRLTNDALNQRHPVWVRRPSP